MSWISIESAALVGSVAAFAVQVRAHLLRRESHHQAEIPDPAPVVAIRQRDDRYFGQEDYIFSIVNRGRFSVNLMLIGAIAFSDSGVFTKMTYEPPNFYPRELQSFDYLALSFPYSKLIELRDKFDDGHVKVFAIYPGGGAYGPEVPFKSFKSA